MVCYWGAGVFGPLVCLGEGMKAKERERGRGVRGGWEEKETSRYREGTSATLVLGNPGHAPSDLFPPPLPICRYSRLPVERIDERACRRPIIVQVSCYGSGGPLLYPEALEGNVPSSHQ